MRLSSINALLLSLALAVTAAQGQSEKAENALILRSLLSDGHEHFEAKLANATVPLNRAFVAKLRKFERQAAEAEDYAQAIVYRDRKLSLTEQLQRHDPKRVKERTANAVTLSLSEASLAGSVTLQRDILKGWKTSATAATWNLRGMKPGSYEVVLTYSCSQATEEKNDSSDKKVVLRAGGQFSFGETSRLLNGQRQPLVHEVLPTADWDTYRDVSLGELTFSNAAISLRLDVIESKPLGLMHLKQVQLLPSAEPAETKPIPQAADLQRSFQSAVKRRKERIRTAYIKDLNTLKQRAKATGNKQLLQDISRALEATSTP